MPAVLQRRFSVHGIEDPPLPVRLVEGVSFEDAALHYLEDRHLAAVDEEVSLLVEDCDTGEQQCFRVDLATGETAPCQ
jgi:uncharacterized protein DUF5961